MRFFLGFLFFTLSTLASQAEVLRFRESSSDYTSRFYLPKNNAYACAFAATKGSEDSGHALFFIAYSYYGGYAPVIINNAPTEDNLRNDTVGDRLFFNMGRKGGVGAWDMKRVYSARTPGNICSKLKRRWSREFNADSACVCTSVSATRAKNLLYSANRMTSSWGLIQHNCTHTTSRLWNQAVSSKKLKVRIHARPKAFVSTLKKLLKR